MRIVSGKHKGKKLLDFKHNIRPTLDKVKQALFTRLQFDIADSVVLDLFSGSGGLGIEAISRNAKMVYFVDNNKTSIDLTKNNIKSIGEERTSKVVFADFKTALLSFTQQFDLIIIDPPYNSDYYLPALQIIKEKNLLKNDGFIVCERLKEKEINQDLFLVETTKIYGTVALDYLINKEI